MPHGQQDALLPQLRLLLHAGVDLVLLVEGSQGLVVHHKGSLVLMVVGQVILPLHILLGFLHDGQLIVDLLGGVDG